MIYSVLFRGKGENMSTHSLTEGSILKPLLKFAIPVIIALILQSLYGAVDLMVVGQFASSGEVSAVATGSQIMHTLTQVVAGLSMGTTILIGQQLGEGNRRDAGRTVGASITFFAVFGLILSIIVGLNASGISTLMHAPAEAFDQTVSYVSICGFGLVFITAYNLLGSLFRGLGNSKLPLISVAIVNSLGVIASAGVGVAEKVCSFIMLVPSAFAQSMAAFVAQNYGAGKMDRAHKGLAYGIGISFAFGVVMAWASFFHGDLMCRLFASDESVVLSGWEYLKAYSIDCMLTPFFFCMTGYFNGCGNTKFVMTQNLFGAICIRVPVSWIMAQIVPVSLFRIGLATPCSSIVQCILCAGYFFLVSKKKEKKHTLTA